MPARHGKQVIGSAQNDPFPGSSDSSNDPTETAPKAEMRASLVPSADYAP
jgi:hypothetical protein